MKKQLSFLLILSIFCFCVSAAPAEAPLVEPSGFQCYWNDAVWELGPEYEDARWSKNESGLSDQHCYVLLEDGTAEIVDMSWYGCWIPETVDGIPVTAIGLLGISDRLDYPSDLELPAWITRISEDAFRYAAHNLFTEVDPANPYFAIRNGMLLDLRNHTLLSCMNGGSSPLPADLEAIGCRALAGVRFESLSLPDGLKRIGSLAFMYCGSLTAVTIPDSVTEIGQNPFAACNALEEIRISPDHPVYGFRDGILYRKADMQAVSILSAYTGEAYTLPGWIRSVGPYAFCGNQELREVRLHDGITEIPEGAFLECESLADIRFPDSVEFIGPDAFHGCGFTEITLPAGLKELGVMAFSYCGSLEEIRFPAGLSAIHEGAFAGCRSLQSVVLPEGLVSLDDLVFSFCNSLVSVVIPDSVGSIGSIFSYCNTPPTVTANPDSFAARYCADNKIDCVAPGSAE